MSGYPFGIGTAIGITSYGETEYFPSLAGYIESFILYNTKLSANEIATISSHMGDYSFISESISPSVSTIRIFCDTVILKNSSAIS